MDLRHLRYFVAVAKTRNFNRAAERLGVRQPTLTRQMNGLERELGVKLFIRTKRGTSLTRAGAAFLIPARRLLALAAKCITELKPFRAGQPRPPR